MTDSWLRGGTWWLIALLLSAFMAGPVTGAKAGDDAAAGNTPPGHAALDFRDIVRQAKGKVFPAVVFIKVLQQSHESGRRITQEVSGSGVLISGKGEILTNWHVVDQAQEVRCLLIDGRAYHARVLGSDKDVDLALIQLELEDDAPELPYADFGDSTSLQEGDFVMAMGAPWGLSRSVSIGIVSCTNRFLPEASQYSLWLQTDAAISPGNSGGPLINTRGQIVGLNTRGVLVGGDMGFALPSQTILQLLPQLRNKGQIGWSWAGLQLQPLRDFNRDMYFPGTDGVIVAETDPSSPARQAGLQPNDRILAINGQAIQGLTEEDLPSIRRLIALLPREVPLQLQVLRNDQPLDLELILHEKGKVEGDELEAARWDMTFKTINRFDNPALYFHREEGVFIFGVDYPGNAAESGLRPSDIVLSIADDPIRSIEDIQEIYEKAMENLDHKPRLLFTVLRNGLMRQIVLDFSRDYEKR